MKKVLVAVVAAALSLGALAFEKYMMRVPDELNPKEGINGVTTYFFAPAAVSIPLRDGTSVYVVNETHKLPSKDGTVQIGVPKKVVDLDVISRYRDAMKGFPSIAVQFGESTFFAYHCGAMFPAPDGLCVDNSYQGVVVSMGLEYSITVYLPKGRGLDAEVREVLKKIRFVPLPGVGVDTALKLYGEGSAVPAAARLKTITKMVEDRGECCELIELLSTLTGDAATKAWCMERLKFLNPGKYAPDARTEIAAYDSNNDAQQNAVMAMLGATDKAEKASVKVPAASAETGVSSVAANKTKTITLPGGAEMEFVWCEKGTFTMGQNDGEWAPSKDEEPRRKITLTKGFWLAKYETTQGQWKSVMGANPSHFTGDDNLPVEMVSWKACREFAEKAGAALGAKMRLPTEAEWEYACRAGTRTTYYWGYQAHTKKANYDGADSFHPERSLPSVGKTVKTGSYEPNPWGFYDMAGNVAEWCEDDWLEKPSAKNAKDPLYKGERTDIKVYRGGAWKGQKFTCRSAERSWFSSANERNWLGVRFVLEDMVPDAVSPSSSPQSASAAAKPVPKASSGRLKSGVERWLLLPGGAKMAMIYCEPGEYTMGRAYANDGDYLEPQIQIKLTKGFWLSKYETTQDQWQSVMGSNPSTDEFKGGDIPVHNVSWNDVQEFVRKVESANAGCGARLPTEAEWEYACRAGATTFYPWGDSLNGDKANVKGDEPFGTGEKGPYLRKLAPVGFYSANAWGFCDTIGNVGEWCLDWYESRGRKTPRSMVDPVGPDAGKSHVIRGGDFKDRAKDTRACSRSYGKPDAKGEQVGFRLACNEVPEGVRPDADVEAPPAPNGLKTGATKKVVLPGGAEMEMIYCAPGSYMMGSTLDEFFALSPSSKDSFANNEAPRHRVVLTKGFWMAKYEFTQAQWKSVMGADSRLYEYLKGNVDFVGDEYPMGCISWESAEELVKEINKEGKITVRLPTEAEWEYACRAGTTTAFPWGDACNGTEANCNGEEPYPYKKGTPGPNLKKATPVGKYPANPWGFCDMLGNMREWCQDWHYYYPWTLKTQVDPVEKEKHSSIRSMRGGSYNADAEMCRSASRSYGVSESVFNYYFGVRLVMDE